MELNYVTNSVNLALQALSALQNQVANNMAGISSGFAEVKRTDFKVLLSQLGNEADVTNSKVYLGELTEQLSQSKAAGATQMAEEVLISQRISGKYSSVIEAYNKQLSLYRLAVTGRV